MEEKPLEDVLTNVENERRKTEQTQRNRPN